MDPVFQPRPSLFSPVVSNRVGGWLFPLAKVDARKTELCGWRGVAFSNSSQRPEPNLSCTFYLWEVTYGGSFSEWWVSKLCPQTHALGKALRADGHGGEGGMVCGILHSMGINKWKWYHSESLKGQVSRRPFWLLQWGLTACALGSII